MHKIVLPNVISNDLAYLSGVIAGDGCLFYRKSKNEYSLVIVGNPKTEKDFYDKTICGLFKKLFSINIKAKYFDKKTTYGIRIYSKDIFNFFTQVIGIPQSPKSGIIEIPEKFKQSDKLISSFICGFVDADFCLSIKKRYKTFPYYPVIIGASKSKKIIQQTGEFLKVKDITFSLELDKISYDKRFKNPTIINKIYIYGNKNLKKWMQCIGFKSQNNLEKVERIKKINSGEWNFRNMDS